MNTQIPWAFVTAVAAKLRDNTRMGYTGLHYGKFMHEMGLVVFIILRAVGLERKGSRGLGEDIWGWS